MPAERTIVIADTGPLIGFARIGELRILPSLFGRVTIPQAVWGELTEGAAEGRSGAGEIQSAPWIDVRAADPALTAAYEMLVDRGEAEAIALASSRSNSLLIIDDRRGRLVARERSISIRGTLGVLRLAREQGLIPRIRPLVDALQAAGIYFAPQLLARFLCEIDESSNEGG